MRTRVCGLLLAGLVVGAVAAAATVTAAGAPGGARLADPAVGPHARDETRHRGDHFAFAPAQSPIIARRSAAPLAASPQVVPYSGRLQREVFGFAPYWSLAQSANWHYDLLSTIAYFGLDVNGNGSFSTSTNGWAGWNSQNLVTTINAAHQAGDRVVVVIKAFDEATINQIVTSGAQSAITNTINAIASKNLDGVNVDFEGSSNSSYPNIQAGMTNFVAQLAAQVHQRLPGSMVSVDTYSGSASWDGGFFNIGGLAPSVDAMFVMAYDMGFGNLSGHAAPNAPLNGWTYNDTTSVSQYLSKAPASKVILGVPYYGYKYSTTSNQPYSQVAAGSSASADNYSGVLDDFSCAVQLSRAWDGTAASPWASWWSPATADPCAGNHNSWRELYYDDATSLGQKYDLVNAKNLRGTGMWALGYDGTSPDLWAVLSAKFTAAATYDLTAVPHAWAVNQTQTFNVSVTNAGFQTWPAGGPNPVRLGLHFASSTGGWPNQVRSGYRAWATDVRISLPADLDPGSTAVIPVTLTAPPMTGAIVLEAEMVREGMFWFNQWASQSVSLAPPSWLATYDMSAVPRVWAVNQRQTFVVTVTNTGNQTWPAAGPNPVRLGIHFANATGGWPRQVQSGYTAWQTDSRISFPADLAPGASAAITVSAQAPVAAVSTVLEAEMVKEQQFWFGQWGPVALRLAGPEWIATYDMSGAPRSWQPGQTQSFTIKATNTGNQAWPAGGTTPVHLGLHFASTAGGWPAQVSSQYRDWLTDQRVALPGDVAVGQTVPIPVTATAPSNGAVPVLEAQLVKEQQFWFGEWTAVAITNVPTSWLGGYDLSQAPRVWALNQTATFNVTLTNTGNQTWPAAGASPVRLGLHFATAGGGWTAQVASAYHQWLSDQRVSLPQDVGPGQSVTVSVTLTAPAAGNPIVLEGEMVKEQQFWFSDWGQVAIAISP